eukprot:1333802-Amorphochlora_amoeboformis.AAC.2
MAFEKSEIVECVCHVSMRVSPPKMGFERFVERSERDIYVMCVIWLYIMPLRMSFEVLVEDMVGLLKKENRQE